MSENEAASKLQDLSIEKEENGDEQVLSVEEVAASKPELVPLAKELYAKGSRFYVLQSYQEAADELSKACELYEQAYGIESPELGMPFLMYGKALIGLAIEENELINPDTTANEESDNKDDDEEGDEEEEEEEATAVAADDAAENGKPSTSAEASNENAEVDSASATEAETKDPSEEANLEEAEDVSNFQAAWEMLELAGKAFSHQGIKGYPYLAEVYTELGNIQFENNDLQNACNDFERALKLYEQIPNKMRRAMAEIYYKIGLAHISEDRHKESLEAFREACILIEEEIQDIKASKSELSESDTKTVEVLEETKAEIQAKASEVEEAGAETKELVKGFLKDYTQSSVGGVAANASHSTTATVAAGSSTSNGLDLSSHSEAPATGASSSSKGKDISHLIKRKRDAEPNVSNNGTESSPAKRAAIE